LSEENGPTTTDVEKASAGVVALSVGLSALALLFYAFAMALLADLHSSDAAGNALGQAYAAIVIILLWALLAALMIIAFAKGAIPVPEAIAAAILIPASGFAAMTALELLSEPHISPFLLPIIIPALIPPLIVAYAFWAVLPPLRAAITRRPASGIVWGAVLVLCVAIVPLQQSRNDALNYEDAVREKYDADLAAMPADAPLWDWVPFLATRNATKRADVLDRIRALDRRQSDAELMLDRGDFPLTYLGQFDLTPTPVLCDKGRGLLRRQVEPLVLTIPNSKPYAEIAAPVADAATAMEWLVGYDCSCDAESLAWESMAKAYQGSNWDIHRLGELRDPKNLGRIERMYPARFSMLTPKSHLKAWLSFAEKTELRDQALAGARQLDHRTADAIEMLTDKYDISAPWMALQYLPALDLEATPALCEAAQVDIRGEIAKIAIPKPDDPRPYSELLERLGSGRQLPALIWLASHRCDVEEGLSEAEKMVRAYQDSTDGAAMLATLAKLHRKP
jgi:hypothetical protein